MILIEFKLHNGKVPYFVKDYMSYKTKGMNTLDNKDKNNNRYLGIARDGDDEYLPDTVKILLEEEFKILIKTAAISKASIDMGKTAEELTEVEKENIADDFVRKNIILDVTDSGEVIGIK